MSSPEPHRHSVVHQTNGKIVRTTVVHHKVKKDKKDSSVEKPYINERSTDPGATVHTITTTRTFSPASQKASKPTGVKTSDIEISTTPPGPNLYANTKTTTPTKKKATETQSQSYGKGNSPQVVPTSSTKQTWKEAKQDVPVSTEARDSEDEVKICESNQAETAKVQVQAKTDARRPAKSLSKPTNGQEHTKPVAQETAVDEELLPPGSNKEIMQPSEIHDTTARVDTSQQAEIKDSSIAPEPVSNVTNNNVGQGSVIRMTNGKLVRVSKRTVRKKKSPIPKSEQPTGPEHIITWPPNYEGHQKRRPSIEAQKMAKEAKFPVDPAELDRLAERHDMAAAMEGAKDDLSSSCEKLFSLLNLDPITERDKLAEEDVYNFILYHPQTCELQYFFDAFQQHVYPLNMLCALGASKDTVEAAFEAQPEALLEVDAWIGTPLHYACSYRASSDVLEFLIRQDATVAGTLNKSGRSPLHMACEYALWAKGVSTLIEKKPDAAQITDCEGKTPLHLACSSGADASVIRAVLNASRLSTSLCDENGCTPLHLACSSGVPADAMEALIGANPSALKTINTSGQTPLHIAAMSSAPPDVVGLLLDAYPEAVNHKTDRGETPLMMAEAEHAPEEIKRILRIAGK